MKYTLASEAALIERVLTFKDDPLSFARWAYPWGQPNTIFHDRKGLTPWQIDELGQITDHISQVKRARAAGLESPDEVYRGAWSSGRGLYKTALFSILNHWHLSTHFGGMTVVAANSESQLRNRVFPELALWVSAAINAHWFVVEGLRITPQLWLSELLVRSPDEGGMSLDPKFWYAGASMWSEERPDAFAGGRSAYGTLVLFDEASGIPEPVWTVTEGFFASGMPYKLWLAASQMRANKGAFYDRFYDAKLKLGWATRVMSVESVPEKAQWARNMIERYGVDSDQVRVEVKGLAPRTSEDQFIPADSLRLAQDNMLVADYGEPLILGVDPAPRGRTVLWFRQGRNARDCVGPATRTVLEGSDNFQIAEKIVELDNRFRPRNITIDFGMGTGVIDVLKRRHLHGRVVEVKFGDTAPDKESEFGSMGAYLWGKLRDWLPGGMVPKDDGEKGSFSHQALNRGWKWSGREDGKKVLEGKDDLKARGLHSPDDVDALATTFAVNPPRTDRVGGGAARKVDGAEDSPYGW